MAPVAIDISEKTYRWSLASNEHFSRIGATTELRRRVLTVRAIDVTSASLGKEMHE